MNVAWQPLFASLGLPHQVHALVQSQINEGMILKHDLQLWCMIETAQGVLNVKEIAQESSFVAQGHYMELKGLIVGSSDLTKDLGAHATPDRHPLLPSIAQVVLAARANDLVAIDGVTFDVQNVAELEKHCIQAMEMGLDGKSLLHPIQIEEINRSVTLGC